MRILLTNDDGINAAGFAVLQQIAAAVGDEVWSVAPETDQSGTAHSLSLHEPLRLKEVAERAGCVTAQLVLRAGDIDWGRFGSIASLGVTAGASAPETLVNEILDAFAERYILDVKQVSGAEENVFFPLPRELRGAA